MAIYGYKPNQPLVWFKKNSSFSNSHCLYCGDFVGAINSKPSNKEHLIGREFVPNGTMRDTSFNFIFRACYDCNTEKSNLERHVSSLTLYNGTARGECEEINNIAIRKAEKDFHPSKRGVTVSKAYETIKIGNECLSFTMNAPPQLVDCYVRMLALFHIQGFFSLLATENPKDKLKLLPEKNFYCHASYAQSDWGNRHILEIVERVKGWPICCSLDLADGYFKIVMRQNEPDNTFFWALEWNKYLRVIGTIGAADLVPTIFANLPEVQWKIIGEDAKSKTRIRENVPFNYDYDLFCFNVEWEEGDSSS